MLQQFYQQEDGRPGKIQMLRYQIANNENLLFFCMKSGTNIVK